MCAGVRAGTYSRSRLGAYSRGALIRGWALIRINAVQCISDSIHEREGESIIEYLKGR